MNKTTKIGSETKPAEICIICGKHGKATIGKQYYCREHFNQLVITKLIVKTGAVQNRNQACGCGSGKKYKHCCSIKATDHKARHYFNSEYINEKQPEKAN